MTGSQTDGACSLLVAAQICDPSGVRRADPHALKLLHSAATQLVDRRAALLRAPGAVAPDGVLSLSPLAPDSVVEIVLAVAAATRPEHTTFCVTLSPSTAGESLLRERPQRNAGTSPTRDLEAAVLGAHAADASARSGLSETDPRESRISVLGPAAARVIGAALDLLLEAYDSMTDRQRQIIQLVKSSRTQQDVATHLGVSRQAVNQSLASARWPHLDRAARDISSSLAELCLAAERTDGGGKAS